MGRRVTSLDVAREAGVSQSAVSRVFTRGASASPEMAGRVRSAADALGYRPNALARGLITGRSRIIGLVVAYLDNPFYPDAIEHLSHALQAEGYHLLIFTTGRDGMDVDRVMGELMDYQVDGIVSASISPSSDITARARAAGIPMVLFNRGLPGSGLPAVTSDNMAGGAKVADFLLAGGHRRIAHIGGYAEASTSRERAHAFRAALEAAGAGLHDERAGDYDRDRACDAARAMMEAPAPPDAIFVSNDHMALAVMDLLRFEMGLSVPRDVSVVGYDDVPMAAWPAYDLTTVRQPTGRMVAATVGELLSRIRDPEQAPASHRIDGPLIVRGSARKPQGWTT